MSAHAVPYLRLVALPLVADGGGAAGAAGTDGADRSPPGPRAEVPAVSPSDRRPLAARLVDGWLFDETKDLDIGGVAAGVFEAGDEL